MWVTVKDFDRDVKVGDRLKHDDPDDNREFIVTSIGKDLFLSILDYESDYQKDIIGKSGESRSVGELNYILFTGLLWAA